MTSSHPLRAPCQWFARLATALARRSAPRLVLLFLGAVLARGRLENQLSDLVFPPKANAANERLAQHLWAHRDELFMFLRQPGLDATNWRAELAIRFGVILRKVWGGSRTWAGEASAVRADVGVADVLAAGALCPGLPQSTPAGP